MRIPLYQVDAFTDRLFGGNPAAVCPLETWLQDDVMQAIAAENNLSETAFFVPQGDDYALRWFTPTTEVDLCGHATLATAFVVLRFLAPERSAVRFTTREAGVLTVARDGDRLALDFPARPPTRVTSADDLLAALGAASNDIWMARDHLVVYPDAETVRRLKPDMTALSRLDNWAVIVTAPGDDDADFVSRFFAPRKGVPEDPVTGSAHCTLVPYWAERLGRTRLLARQVSQRGGTLYCSLVGDRVTMAGDAVLYLQGMIEIPS